jgi:predicted Zn finger-like uncharacterized protein
MPIIIDCPSCQRKLRVPEHLLGQKVKCPTCANMFTAATEGAAQAETLSVAQPEPRRPDPYAERLGAPPPPHLDEDDDDPMFAEERARRSRRLDLEPHRGTLILVLGILSLVLTPCAIILGPIAWIMGQNDLSAMRAGRMDDQGRDLTNAGRICGIIGTCLIAAICLLYVGIFAMVGVGARAMRF